MKRISYLILLLLGLNGQILAQQVKQLRITILSTMLTDTIGKGEWGFSALVEADGHKILFDTGTDSMLVLNNAKEWGIDLSEVPVLILSHSHGDHTGGWHALRNTFKVAHPAAFSTTFVGDGFFLRRYNKENKVAYDRTDDSLRYVAEGGQIRICRGFTQIYPGVWLTGLVPRKFQEKNYGKDFHLQTAQGNTEDNVPEDMSLVFATTKGLVMLSGCGHSGIINTLTYVQQNLPGKLYAADGGFHLLNAGEQQLDFTAKALKAAGLQYFIGAHCTGINVVYEIRKRCGLERNQSVVGSVGSYFDLATGITPGFLSK